MLSLEESSIDCPRFLIRRKTNKEIAASSKETQAGITTEGTMTAKKEKKTIEIRATSKADQNKRNGELAQNLKHHPKKQNKKGTHPFEVTLDTVKSWFVREFDDQGLAFKIKNSGLNNPDTK